MSGPNSIDGVLVQWGDRLFYPGNRTVNSPGAGLTGGRQGAAAIRARIAATVLRRAPQVMVKVTGGGRGMRAIAAHFRYISKNGRLDIEDDRGETFRGKDELGLVTEDWRFGRISIEPEGFRREAYNIMLSMPNGTSPQGVLLAAKAFARAELAGHKYLMVLHDHQANPHVHLSLRAESRDGTRLYPRKADLRRWRETFAEKLRERGIDAEATRQASRGATRNQEPLWRLKASEDGRLRKEGARVKTGSKSVADRQSAVESWREIGEALRRSSEPTDRVLAQGIAMFLDEMRDGNRDLGQGAVVRPASKARVASRSAESNRTGNDAVILRGDR